jgi:hypothetical protein
MLKDLVMPPEQVKARQDDTLKYVFTFVPFNLFCFDQRELISDQIVREDSKPFLNPRVTLVTKVKGLKLKIK